MSQELITVGLGLAAAAGWGAGDFAGGIASRRSPAHTVVLVSQFVGLILLAGLAWLLAEPIPSSADLLWGAAAGLAGALGLIALYRGLAVGPMAIVAPLTALITAGLPLLWGLFLEGLPAMPQLVGFGLALLAVWLISAPGGEVRLQKKSLALALLAGLGFGVFLGLIGQLSDGAVLWPLVSARVASTTVLALATVRRLPAKQGLARPLALMALIGVLDAWGNALYVLAAQVGRLDTAAVVSSLYPAGTALLALLILKERLAGRQRIGLLAALAAVALIAA